MVDATVPDIALEPDKAVKKVQDRLRYFFSLQKCRFIILILNGYLIL